MSFHFLSSSRSNFLLISFLENHHESKDEVEIIQEEIEVKDQEESPIKREAQPTETAIFCPYTNPIQTYQSLPMVYMYSQPQIMPSYAYQPHVIQPQYYINPVQPYMQMSPVYLQQNGSYMRAPAQFGSTNKNMWYG